MIRNLEEFYEPLCCHEDYVTMCRRNQHGRKEPCHEEPELLKLHADPAWQEQRYESMREVF